MTNESYELDGERTKVKQSQSVATKLRRHSVYNKVKTWCPVYNELKTKPSVKRS